jgi:hypothetical protein
MAALPTVFTGCPMHGCYWRQETRSRFDANHSVEAHLVAAHGLRSCDRASDGAALTADERELFIRLGTQLADIQADARGSLVELDLGTATATTRRRPRNAA